MGFFKDFKRDFAQAVNELMPEDGELSSEYDDEDMVNTFDEDVDEDMDEDVGTDIAPEDLMDEEFEDTGEPVVETLSAREDEQDDEIFVPATDNKDSDSDEAFGEKAYEAAFGTGEGSGGVLPENLLSGEEAEKDKENEYDQEDAEAEEDEEAEEADSEAEETEEADEEDLDESEEDSMTEHESMSIDAAVFETLEKEAENDLVDDADEVDDMYDSDIKTKDAMTEKRENVDSVMSDDTTYITKGTKIKGDIETDGGVDVLGSVTGNIKCMGKLILGGTVKGNVNAGEIYANAAKIEGEVVAEGGVKIGVGSVVIGNITATSAIVSGAVNGDIDIKGPVIVDSTAVIMGNIKSRTVQINNGAVIEGFCSQCYSEIDVKSFFGNAE